MFCCPDADLDVEFTLGSVACSGVLFMRLMRKIVIRMWTRRRTIMMAIMGMMSLFMTNMFIHQ